MISGFLKNVYGILFEPRVTIDKLVETKPLSQALFLIILLSISACLLSYKFLIGNVLDWVFLVGNIFAILISSLVFWFVLAGFFECVSRIFNDESHYKQILTLMGFSLLPWIFTAPLELIKINAVLSAVSSLLEVAIWFWSIFLIFISVQKLYRLTVKKTWLFLMTPFLGGIIAVNWVSQFFAIVISIF